MEANTAEQQQCSASSWIWIAGAVGTAAGVASLLYSQSRLSPWEKAKRKVVLAADTARSEAKPWMGVVAGAAVGSAALAYWLKPKPSAWEQAGRRTQQIAAQAKHQLEPWMSLAASTAIGLVSAAYSRRTDAQKSVGEGTRLTADKLAETGLQLLRRVQRISSETGKLYPQVRKLIA